MKKRILLGALVLLATLLGATHWLLPGMIEKSINQIEPHKAYTVSPETDSLHDQLFVVDLHSDSLLWKRDLRQPGSTGHLDIPRMQKGNIALQVFSATTKSPKAQNYDKNTGDSDNITSLAMAQLWPPRTWSSLYERADYQLDKLLYLDSTSDLVLVKSANDLRKLINDRQQNPNLVGALYLIEGAHPLEGNLANLERLYDKGLRIVGLVHFFDNRLGGSLHGVSGEGLTDFGRSVIRKADELGMIIDIAHASPQMVEDVLSLTHRPVILSHGGLKGACDTARNLSDELMIRMARQGGLLGVGFWDAAVCDITPQGIVKSIQYAIDLLGEDHVALGSDYDGATRVAVDAGELKSLTHAMLASGMSETVIRKVMGENAKNFFLENLP